MADTNSTNISPLLKLLAYAVFDFPPKSGLYTLAAVLLKRKLILSLIFHSAKLCTLNLCKKMFFPYLLY
ncbi:MAG: hypothetical protein ABF683_13770 [Sporolactobacillus sp.]